MSITRTEMPIIYDQLQLHEHEIGTTLRDIAPKIPLKDNRLTGGLW